MSKYKKRGDYHFREYLDKDSDYHQHISDVTARVTECLDYDPGHTILDAGCGEGLVVWLFREYGYSADGVEMDPYAVKLAKDHGLGAFVKLDKFDGEHDGYDVVMFLDSLEHMEGWSKILLNASLNTSWLVIAVPDRHDKHAVNQDMVNDVAGFMRTIGGFECVVRVQRHARHLLIYKKMTL